MKKNCQHIEAPLEAPHLVEEVGEGIQHHVETDDDEQRLEEADLDLEEADDQGRACPSSHRGGARHRRHGEVAAAFCVVREVKHRVEEEALARDDGEAGDRDLLSRAEVEQRPRPRVAYRRVRRVGRSVARVPEEARRPLCQRQAQRQRRVMGGSIHDEGIV